MKQVRQLALGTAGVIVALGVGAAAHRTRTRLRVAVRTAIAHAAGVSVDAVSIGDARIGWSGLVVTEVAAGQVACKSVRVVPSPWSLVGTRLDGKIEVDGLVLEDPPIGPFGRAFVEHVDVTLGSRVRVHAHDIRFEPDGVLAQVGQLEVRDIGVELDRVTKTITRAAFTGLGIGPLHDLAGGLHRHEGSTALVAAAPGVKLEARLDHGDLVASAALDHYALKLDGTPWLARIGVPRGALELTGQGALELPRDFVGHVDLDVDAGGTIAIPRLAATDLPADGTHVRVVAELDDGLDGTVTLARGDASLVTKVQLDTDGLQLDTALPEVACAQLLRSLPAPLKPALDGLGLGGDVAGHFALAVPFDDPAALTLDGDLDNRCIVVTEPPLADAGKLVHEAPAIDVRDAQGNARHLVLGPGSASFRSIDRVSQKVVDTFLGAEDARFFHHKGVDLGAIKSALAHDLEAGAPGRGGSTITQQVAKNLFLSGERTIGRKLEEAVLAWRLEQRLGKRRILELYLNLVELGPGIYGVNEGASAYFGKPLEKLDADELAKLAALLPAPRRGMDEAWRKRVEALEARLPALARQP